jgi:chemotaxis protein methyltransferase CheR
MSGWSSAQFSALARLVTERAGLAFPESRIVSAEAGIRRAMKRQGVCDAERYVELVATSPQAFATLLTEVTVGETYFFRQRAHFDLIRAQMLPDLFLRDGARHRVRIWSAGCSSGEEPYSLAIMLTEANVSAQILATDVSEGALARARAGVYRRWSLRECRAADVARALHQRGERWIIDERYRDAITFANHNLVGSDYPPSGSPPNGFDLILCRNVLIYFDEQTIAHVTAGLVSSLDEGGWLLTGPHDPLLVHPALTAEPRGDCVVYRRQPLHHSRAAKAVAEPSGVHFGPPVMLEEHPVQTGHDACHGESTVDSSADVTRRLADAAFAAGRYEETLRFTEAMRDEHGAMLRIHSTANAHGSVAALAEIERQLQQHPLSAALHLLHTLVLMDLGRRDEATVSLRRTLYLDPTSVIANALLRSSRNGMAGWRTHASEPLTQTDKDALGPATMELM